MSAENKINQIYIIRNSSEIRNINVKINIPSNFTYNKKKKKYSKLSSFNASESPFWSHFPSTGRTVAIFPRDVNKLQLPLPSSSRYLPLIYFRVRTAVHPQLNGNQDVPVISRVSIQPEVREISLSLSLLGTWRKVFYAVPRGEEGGRGRINQTAPRDKTAFRFASWN